jgi:hypothetical protein
MCTLPRLKPVETCTIDSITYHKLSGIRLAAKLVRRHRNPAGRSYPDHTRNLACWNDRTRRCARRESVEWAEHGNAVCLGAADCLYTARAFALRHRESRSRILAGLSSGCNPRFIEQVKLTVDSSSLQLDMVWFAGE